MYQLLYWHVSIHCIYSPDDFQYLLNVIEPYRSDHNNNNNNDKDLLTRVLIRCMSIFHKALNTT